MKLMKDYYFGKGLLVNRIKSTVDDEDIKYAIHVNRIDGYRANGWIPITDNMTLYDTEGKPISWSDMQDGTYYNMVFDVPEHKSNNEVTPIQAHIIEEYF